MRRDTGYRGQMAKAEALQIGQAQAAAGGGHMRQGGGVLVTVGGGIRKRRQADAVEDDPDGTTGGAFRRESHERVCSDERGMLSALRSALSTFTMNDNPR